jgi:hypothetical protein
MISLFRLSQLRKNNFCEVGPQATESPSRLIIKIIKIAQPDSKRTILLHQHERPQFWRHAKILVSREGDQDDRDPSFWNKIQ